MVLLLTEIDVAVNCTFPWCRSNLQSAPPGAGGMQHPLREPFQPHAGQRAAPQPVLRHPGWHQGRRPADPPPLHVPRGGVPAPGQDKQRPAHGRGAPGQGTLRGAQEYRNQSKPAAATATWKQQQIVVSANGQRRSLLSASQEGQA